MNAERKFIKNKLCRYVHIIKKGLQKKCFWKKFRMSENSSKQKNLLSYFTENDP